ncbi:hypothetical protein JXO59_14580 [candidate division KSB1 bacterium]|nr:hypothetical protein [candidate division KSB1 bacterium]
MNKLFLLIIIPFTVLFAQTIRPSHWLSDYIRFAQARGYLWSLSPLTQPYESAEILALVQQELEKGGIASPIVAERTRYMIDRLLRQPRHDGEGCIGVDVEQKFQVSDSDRYFHSINRLGAVYRFRPWLYGASVTLMDNRLDEDANYMGIRQSGVSAYHESAYILLRHEGWSFIAGRDFLRLGPGIDATLFLSDHSRPLDHLHLAYQAKYWRYTFIFAQLDHFIVDDGSKSTQMNRYLALHRLEIRPYPRLRLSVGEAVLYGSTAGVHWAYLNPFIFFHGEQMNGPQAGNILGSLQAAWMPWLNLTLYVDLLIDDIQLEKSVPGDFEPNEYGLIAGWRWADPCGLNGLDIFAEYSRVTQRTYNSMFGDWEKCLHRRLPIGHFLGNDFDRILVGWQYWPVPSRRLRMYYENRRKGEDRIDKPFTDPWMDTPDYRNYTEPFPTGIVEHSHIFNFDLEWHPLWWLRGWLGLEYTAADNFDHQIGTKKDYWQMQIGLSIEGIVKGMVRP